MEKNPYPSDVTDEQWTFLKRLIPPARPGERPRSVDLRQIGNAIFYRTRSACSWRMLPRDFPPGKTVSNYFAAWKLDGTWKNLVASYGRYDLPEWVEGHRQYALHIVWRPEGSKGVVLLPKRWVVERTIGWIGRYGRLSKDDERRSDASEAMVQIALVHLVLQRLAPNAACLNNGYTAGSSMQAA